MRYLLVEVIEREISVPEFFDTHEEAHDQMCECVSEVIGTTVEEVKESYLNGEEYNERTCVLHDSAWTERHGNNFDWKIFMLNDAKEFV